MGSRVYTVSWTLKKPMIMLIGISVVHAEEMWFWGEVVFLDSSLYFLTVVLGFGERHS
jgi:hypothetical protein